MRTLVLSLFNKKNRPSFEYESNGFTFTALFDSGAEAPVWCAGEKDFLSAYPDAVKQDWECEIYGFGKNPEKGSVYVIPKFELCSNKRDYPQLCYVFDMNGRYN